MFSFFYNLFPKLIGVASVLPNYDESKECIEGDSTWTEYWEPLFRDSDKLLQSISESTNAGYLSDGTKIESVLACAIKTGHVAFWMIPYFIRFALDFVVQLGGLIVILMIMIGAYYYIAGGITDDKEKGKKIITYAIGGYVLVLVSWIIVNVILLALTS